MKLQFVSDIKDWKYWWSLRFIVISALFQSLTIGYAALPTDWQAEFPGWLKLLFGAGALITTVGAAVSRVIKQAKPSGDPTHAEEVHSDQGQDAQVGKESAGGGDVSS